MKVSIKVVEDFSVELPDDVHPSEFLSALNREAIKEFSKVESNGWLKHILGLGGGPGSAQFEAWTSKHSEPVKS